MHHMVHSSGEGFDGAVHSAIAFLMDLLALVAILLVANGEGGFVSREQF